MALRKMDGSWMSKFSKAALLLLLPVSMAVTSFSHSAESAPEAKPAVTAPADTGTSAKQAVKDNKADVTGFEELKFTEQTDLDALVKTYPGIEAVVNAVKEYPPEHRSTINTAVVKYSPDKSPVLFVQSMGKLDCGTAGCSLSAFTMNKDGKLTRVLNVSANIPIMMRKSDDNLRIYFCTGQGSREWELQQGVYEPTNRAGQPVSPACSL